MRQSRQSPENSVHKAPHGADRAPAEEFLTEGFLLLVTHNCRHGQAKWLPPAFLRLNSRKVPPFFSEHRLIAVRGQLLHFVLFYTRPGHISQKHKAWQFWETYGDSSIKSAHLQHCIGLHKQPP